MCLFNFYNKNHINLSFIFQAKNKADELFRR